MGAQMPLFSNEGFPVSLPRPTTRWITPGLSFDEILLCKGSMSSPERTSFVRAICDSIPSATVRECPNTAHNRIVFSEDKPLKRNERGKHSLVFGELALERAVQPNRKFKQTGMHPYPRFFSVYGGCPHACSYCYLNDTPGTSFSPTVKVFVNMPEILGEIDRQANEARAPMAFYHGKYQDGLALDPLTAYSTILVPFFAGHRSARQVIQTKSANVERLLPLAHAGHTAISWTISPERVAAEYEAGAPSTERRISAMARCAEAGYPVAVNLAPVIPEVGWRRTYLELVEEILRKVAIRRLYVDGICLQRDGLVCMEQQLGKITPFPPISIERSSSVRVKRNTWTVSCKLFSMM